MTRLRLAVMGSPGFAVPILAGVHAAGHAVVAVYCQPPRPAGRGQNERRCAVHEAAISLGLEVRHPARLKADEAAQAAFGALDLDAAVVAAYGLILPPAMLRAPRRGCLNVHASLLPRWRGAAPIQAAIAAGDAQTGITIMRMDAGLDTGPMLVRGAVPITPDTRTPALHDTLAVLGRDLMLRVLDDDPPPVPQPAEHATYAPKLTRAQARIDWSRPAEAIERTIRAFDPWPGTETMLGGAVLKVHAAEPVAGAGPHGTTPGTTLDDRLTIACGVGALRLTQVQAQGRARMAAGDFLRGHAVPPGIRLG